MVSCGKCNLMVKFDKGYHDVIETLSLPLSKMSSSCFCVEMNSYLSSPHVLSILCFRYYGSLEMMNENGTSFGRYCGNKTGQAVVLNGSLVVLRDRSGYYGSYGRFRLRFTPVNRKYSNAIQLKLKMHKRESFTRARGVLS